MRDIGPLGLMPENPLNDIDYNILGRNKIVVSRTEGVSYIDYYAIVTGMKRIIREVGLILGVQEAPDYFEKLSEYKHLDYPEAYTLPIDLGFGTPVNIGKFHTSLRKINNIREEPQLDCLLVSEDLAEPNASKPDWVYGSNSYPIQIISTARWGLENTPLEREKSLEIVGAHELCHLYGLVSRNYNSSSNGKEIHHCMGVLGPCIMEPFSVGKKTLKQIMIETEERTNLLCSDCRIEMNTRLSFFRDFGLQI